MQACQEALGAGVLLQGAAFAQQGCSHLAASQPLAHLACLSDFLPAQRNLALVQLATQLSQRHSFAAAEQVSCVCVRPGVCRALVMCTRPTNLPWCSQHSSWRLASKAWCGASEDRPDARQFAKLGHSTRHNKQRCPAAVHPQQPLQRLLRVCHSKHRAGTWALSLGIPLSAAVGCLELLSLLLLLN